MTHPCTGNFYSMRKILALFSLELSQTEHSATAGKRLQVLWNALKLVFMEVFPFWLPRRWSVTKNRLWLKFTQIGKTQWVEQENAIHSHSWVTLLGSNMWHLSYSSACKKRPKWERLGSLTTQPSIILLIELRSFINVSWFFLYWGPSQQTKVACNPSQKSVRASYLLWVHQGQNLAKTSLNPQLWKLRDCKG